MKRKLLLIFIFLLIAILGYFYYDQKSAQYAFTNVPNEEVIESKKVAQFKLRKHKHVTAFYQMLAQKVTEICIEDNIPPAALLAIAGLESGWNRGYIGKITGNMLSLGAHKGDTTLPALRLPRLKLTGEILFDSLEIMKYNKNELKWENRPRSKKKDYRPKPYAGSKFNLAYFKYHPKERSEAYIQNFNDFISVFISKDSNIKAYRETKELMDKLVKHKGKNTLLSLETTYVFLNGIGGKKNSYNYRKSWLRKVKSIIRNAGLISLTTDLNNGKTFEETW